MESQLFFIFNAAIGEPPPGPSVPRKNSLDHFEDERGNALAKSRHRGEDATESASHSALLLWRLIDIVRNAFVII